MVYREIINVSTLGNQDMTDISREVEGGNQSLKYSGRHLSHF